VRRWIDDIEKKAEVKILGTDIEARGNSVGTLWRLGSTDVENVEGSISRIQVGIGVIKADTLEGAQAGSDS
jgi:hypothetical protein